MFLCEVESQFFGVFSISKKNFKNFMEKEWRPWNFWFFTTKIICQRKTSVRHPLSVVVVSHSSWKTTKARDMRILQKIINKSGQVWKEALSDMLNRLRDINKKTIEKNYFLSFKNEISIFLIKSFSFVFSQKDDRVIHLYNFTFCGNFEFSSWTRT
jgi:hypothetical protein